MRRSAPPWTAWGWVQQLGAEGTLTELAVRDPATLVLFADGGGVLSYHKPDGFVHTLNSRHARHRGPRGVGTFHTARFDDTLQNLIA